MKLENFDEFANLLAEIGPDDLGGNLELVVPERFNFARDVLDRLAADPDKLAIWWVGSAGGERKVTFAEIAEQSRRACNFLADQGVAPGDVVVVLLPRIVEWWVLNIACLRMGAVISPGPAQLRSADIEYRLSRTGACCVIAHNEVAPRVDEIIERCPEVRSRVIVGGNRPEWRSLEDGMAASPPEFETIDNRSDDTAAIYFTSGTEGNPKLAAHTHVSFPLRSKLTGIYWLDLRDGELHWNLSDTGWAKAGWSSLYGPWNQGAAVFVVDSPRFAGPLVKRLEELGGVDWLLLSHKDDGSVFDIVTEG